MSHFFCISDLQQRLENFTPSSIAQELPEAAVLLALTASEQEPEIIFTQRSAHLTSHAGQVAFPGGKKDPEDIDLYQTALREAEEEIALPRNSVQLLGQLSQVVSRQGILVNPYIGLVEGEHELLANEGELDAIFHVPVSHFLSTPPDCFDCIKHPGGALYIPCYFYDEFEIWGLSAMILSEFLEVGFDAGFDLWEKPADSKIRYR
ncbi:CoA pyrophosphatase [Litoribrevibacter albus]|uniref:CoA pyrophosphatase n=1 Tax=Litoribrevibacter albus TaxID=1473156 RepID=UPI0024E057B4|nr:CoA pyrophosphatase [Litoribrevibacter albus]